MCVLYSLALLSQSQQNLSRFKIILSSISWLVESCNLGLVMSHMMRFRMIMIYIWEFISQFLIVGIVMSAWVISVRDLNDRIRWRFPLISQMKSIQTYLQEESDRGERRSKWQGKLGKQLGPGWGWVGGGSESLEEFQILVTFGFGSETCAASSMSRVCLGMFERRLRRMQKSKGKGFLEGSLVKK